MRAPLEDEDQRVPIPRCAGASSGYSLPETLGRGFGGYGRNGLWARGEVES